MLVAVAGCVAQAEGAEIMRRQPAVDLVVGPQAYHRLPELIARAHRAAGERAGRRLRARGEVRRAADRARAAGGVTAFLTVQEGCDKFCTFCVVPYTRGAGIFAARPPRSRPRRERLAGAGRARGHPARPERQRLRDGEAAAWRR